MNITIIICIIIVLCTFVFVVNRKANYENFELQESIQKVLIDYDSIIADTELIKGPKPVSFWKPFISNGVYALGSAVSRDTNNRPEKQYTAITGTDIKNVVDYELVYKAGRTNMEINRDIAKNTNDINNRNNIISVNQKYIDLYNNANPDMAMGIIESTNNIDLRRNLVTDESNYISQPDNIKTWENTNNLIQQEV